MSPGVRVGKLGCWLVLTLSVLLCSGVVVLLVELV